MSEVAAGGAPRRVLLAAGTSEYSNKDDFPPLQKVPEAVATVIDLLTGWPREPYESIGQTRVAPSSVEGRSKMTPGLLNPPLDDLKRRLKEAAATGDVVVVYYTGHGVHPAERPYFLTVKDTDPDDLDESALRFARLTEDLLLRKQGMDAAGQQPQVLVIVDCCFAEAGGDDTLASTLRDLGNPNTWVLASATSVQWAQQGVFADAFVKALAQPNVGRSTPYIGIETVLELIRQHIPNEATQTATAHFPRGKTDGTPPFFPNPDYRPNVAGLTVAIQQHWMSRLTGGREAAAEGFYLTGRTGRISAARHLADWIADPARKGMAVVTGSPGSGKSTLLALPPLLTRSESRGILLQAEQSLRDTRAEGTPKYGTLASTIAEKVGLDTALHAVHARGAEPDQVARQVAEGLGRSANTGAALIDALDMLPLANAPVIIVDAVDEAINPAGLLRGLLLPLVDQGVKVVVGARRYVLRPVTTPDLLIDLDRPDYQDPDALIHYTAQILRATHEPDVATPYRGIAGEKVDRVAAAIAARATSEQPSRSKAESFLLARLLATAVRGRPVPIRPDSPTWQEQVPATIGNAFDEDLAHLGDLEPATRVLLTALAWACGNGLPWETIWAPVANAIAAAEGLTITVTDDHIRALLRSRAAAYVVEDLGPGARSVFRPFHDLLATHLRREPTEDQPDEGPGPEQGRAWRRQAIETAITTALIDTVPHRRGEGRDWPLVHPYVATYLAEHALAADSLERVLHDLGYLTVADTEHLASVIEEQDPRERSQMATVVRTCAHRLPGLDPSERLTLLAMTAAQLGLADLQGRLNLYNSHAIQVRWAHSQGTPARRLDDNPDRVRTVAFGTGAVGQPLLAAAGDGQAVRLWDPTTGKRVGYWADPRIHDGDPNEKPHPWVSTMAFGSLADGRPVLAIAGLGSTVQLRDPATGDYIGAREIEVPQDRDAPIAAVNSVAFGELTDGSLVLATAGLDRDVRLWDPDTGTLIRTLIGHEHDHSDYVQAVTFGRGGDGRPLLATASRDTIVRLWDPDTGTLIRALIGHEKWVEALAFGTRSDGTPVVATASRDNTARLWDADTGKPLLPPLHHDAEVTAVAFGRRANGTPVVATASRDNTARLWDPDTRKGIADPLAGLTKATTALVFVPGRHGSPRLAAGDDATVRLWDLDTGVGAPPRAYSPLTALTLGRRRDGRSVLVTASEDRTLRFWEPETGEPISEATSDQVKLISALAFGRGADHQPLLATAGNDATLRLLDPDTGEPISEATSDQVKLISALAFGRGADDQPLLASAGHSEVVQLWDLGRGTPTLLHSLPGHTDMVHAIAFGRLADGRPVFATADEKPQVQIWDLEAGALVGKPITTTPAVVKAVAFGTLTDGRPVLATGSSDGTINLWDPATGELIHALMGHEGQIVAVALGTESSGHAILATASADKTVRIWDPDGLESIGTVALLTAPASVAIDGRDLYVAAGISARKLAIPRSASVTRRP